jgi:hypothetical protein
MTITDQLPRCRAQLIVRPLGERGQHVVKDPVAESYYELGPEEAFLLQKLDGGRNAQEVCAEFARKFGRPLDESELSEFLELAQESDFLDDKSIATAPVLAASAKSEAPRDDQSILHWRFSLMNPDRLLAAMEPHLRFLWTRAFVIVSTCAIVFAAVILFNQRDAAVSQFAHAFHWQTLLIAWIALVLMDWAHEFAHGLTCKHWGGRVREIGVYLIYFTPSLFCNVSDAWLFKEKSRRMWVTLAGGWCDLCVWALAVFIWRATMPDTLLNHLAWIVMGVTGVLSFFNFNPLLKLDGYYLLSDAVALPNLRQRSWDRWTGFLRCTLWGAPAPDSALRGTFLLLFGFLSWAYSVLLLLALTCWAIWYVGQSWGRPGALLAAGMGAWVMRSQFDGIFQGEVRNMIRTRRRRTLAWIAGAALVAAALLWLPVPDRASGAFELRALRRADVRAPVAGLLKAVYCTEGQRSRPAMRWRCLMFPTCLRAWREPMRRWMNLAPHIRTRRYGAARVSAASVSEEVDLRDAEVAAEEAVLAGLKHEADFLTDRQSRLRITTPVAGSVCTPRLAQQVGRFFSEGELICLIEDPSDLEAEIRVPEQSVRFVRVGQSVTLRPRATVLKTVQARVTRIAPAATTQSAQMPHQRLLRAVRSELSTGDERLRSHRLSHESARPYPARVHHAPAPNGVLVVEPGQNRRDASAAQLLPQRRAENHQPDKPSLAIDASRTIAAARSFACFASGWISGQARSTTVSIAVFTPSRIITPVIANISISHSRREMRSQIPRAQAIRPSTRWIRALRCVRKKKTQPAKAN